MFSNGWGGAERLFVELCSCLSQKGHDVLAVCKSGFPHEMLLSGHNALNYTTIPARCNWDYLSVLQLQKILRNYEPDIIHAHLSRASWMAGLLGDSLGVPVVSTTHNKIKIKYISRIDYFTTITSELKTYLESSGFKANHIRKVPNFSLLPPVTLVTTSNQDPLVFVALGRFVHKKGFDVLLKAFKAYVNVSSVPARLRLAGDGPLNKQLRELANQLGIANLIDFTGWVDDIVSFYDSGDIFILPSRDEPFGIVLIEAMARGKAIIASNIGGPRDFLDQSTAFLVPPDDSKALCEAMQQAAAQPALCSSKATAALKLFRSQYTKDAVLPEFIDFYEYILQTSKTVRAADL
jgi:glycosyltransferase involved in cell wall biosynthesis